MNIESALGQGTRILLRFPFAASAREGTVPDTLVDLSEGARRALVVDDEPMVREVVAALLSEQDWEVSSVGELEGALAMLERHVFDLLVTDVRLDQESGFDLGGSDQVGWTFPTCPLHHRICRRRSESHAGR